MRVEKKEPDQTDEMTATVRVELGALWNVRD